MVFSSCCVSHSYSAPESLYILPQKIALQLAQFLESEEQQQLNPSLV